MFVDHGLWPPPPSEPPAPPERRVSEAQEKRIGWALVAAAVAMVAGPLAGSSLVNALVAVAGSGWRALAG